MQKLLILIFTIPVLAVLNYSVYEKEQILKDGDLIYLELAPVDPRSIMQGDYMRLNYTIANTRQQNKNLNNQGYIKVKVGQDKVAEHIAFTTSKAGLNADEKLFKYTGKRWRNVTLNPNTYMFQEGHAHLYQQARYGVFKFKGAYDYVLVGLADADKKIITPKTL